MAKYFYDPRLEYDSETGIYSTTVYRHGWRKNKVHVIIKYPDWERTISWARFITDYMNGK